MPYVCPTLCSCTNEVGFGLQLRAGSCFPEPRPSAALSAPQVAVLYALAEWRLSESKPVRETLLTAVRLSLPYSLAVVYPEIWRCPHAGGYLSVGRGTELCVPEL